MRLLYDSKDVKSNPVVVSIHSSCMCCSLGLVQIENKELRDLLNISKGSMKTAKDDGAQPPSPPPAAQWEHSPLPASDE